VYWAFCLVVLPRTRIGARWSVGEFSIIAGFVAAGGYWTWRISMWWRKTIAVYTEGIVIVRSGKTRVYKWEELAWIKMLNLVTTVNFVPSRYRRCQISPLSGNPFTVSSGVAAGKEFYDEVVRYTFPHFWRMAAEAYNTGGWVDFGPIRASKSLGLEISGKRFDWKELGPIKIRGGVIYVSPQKGRLLGARSVSAHRVQNLSVCLRFIQELMYPAAPGELNPQV
jgi:hypothetical protein